MYNWKYVDRSDWRAFEDDCKGATERNLEKKKKKL